MKLINPINNITNFVKAEAVRNKKFAQDLVFKNKLKGEITPEYVKNLLNNGTNGDYVICREFPHVIKKDDPRYELFIPYPEAPLGKLYKLLNLDQIFKR